MLVASGLCSIPGISPYRSHLFKRSDSFSSCNSRASCRSSASFRSLPTYASLLPDRSFSCGSASSFPNLAWVMASPLLFLLASSLRFRTNFPSSSLPSILHSCRPTSDSLQLLLLFCLESSLLRKLSAPSLSPTRGAYVEVGSWAASPHICHFALIKRALSPSFLRSPFFSSHR